MKVIKLLLVLCLLFVLDCKSSKEVLKCAIGRMGSGDCNTFVNTFKSSSTAAYALLATKKSALKSAIKNCL